jgi:hypothetical protein
MNDENKIIEDSAPYFQNFEFENNQVDRILQLLTLKSVCLRKDSALHLHFNNFEPAMTFFSAISLATDNLLAAQINDQVAACMYGRGPTPALVEKIMETALSNGVAVPELAIADLPDLFSNRTDYIIGSCFLDFVVSSYAAFEMFFELIYDKLRAQYPSSCKQQKRVAALIERYNKASPEEKPSALRRIIEKGGDHVSGAKKIEFVLSKLPDTYARDRVEDLKIIHFYGKIRNSIHTLGKNKWGKDFRLQGDDFEITLLTGEGTYSKDRSDITRLCGKLVEIYLAVFLENANLGEDTYIATTG